MASFVTVETPSTSTVTLTDTVTTVEVYGRGLGEAPLDGRQYARQDAAWTVVDTSEGGIPDAPANDITYGRKNNSWQAVDSGGIGEAPLDGYTYARFLGDWTRGVSEAPLDGQEYARKNGNWTVTTGGGGGSSIPVVHPVQVASEGQTVFAVPTGTASSSSLLVYINGVYQPLHNWSLSGVQITFSVGLKASDKVDVTLLSPIAEDYAAGVSSLNNLDGALTINAGNNISVTSNGSNALTVAAQFEIVESLPDPSGYADGDVVLLVAP